MCTYMDIYRCCSLYIALREVGVNEHYYYYYYYCKIQQLPFSSADVEPHDRQDEVNFTLRDTVLKD